MNNSANEEITYMNDQTSNNIEDSNTNKNTLEKVTTPKIEENISQPIKTTIYKINSKSTELNENTQTSKNSQTSINNNADKITDSSIFKNEDKLFENNQLPITEKISLDNIIQEDTTNDKTMKDENIFTKLLNILLMISEYLNIYHI